MAAIRARRRAGKQAKGNNRRETRELRRRQLIEATLDSLARHGYSQTTMATFTPSCPMTSALL